MHYYPTNFQLIIGFVFLYVNSYNTIAIIFFFMASSVLSSCMRGDTYSHSAYKMGRIFVFVEWVTELALYTSAGALFFCVVCGVGG